MEATKRVCRSCGKQMSDFDANELEKCWNCGTPISGSNDQAPAKPVENRTPPNIQSINPIWLILPWLVAFGIFVAYEFGLPNWIRLTFPFELGRMALRNAGWGLLLLTFGCSARWAYLRYSNVITDAIQLVVTVVCLTILITLIQMCIAGCIFLAFWFFLASLYRLD